MNAEYQRLEAEASKTQQQINEFVSSCSQMVATEFQKFEAKIAGLHQRLMGLRQGMGLLKLAGSAKMQKEAAALAKSQPKTFYSKGTRPKTVQLTSGVTVTLDVTYYHRSVSPEKAKNKKSNRGMFPVLILLGIGNGFTAGVRQPMMKWNRHVPGDILLIWLRWPALRSKRRLKAELRGRCCLPTIVSEGSAPSKAVPQ